jgi:hypothetical protein
MTLLNHGGSAIHDGARIRRKHEVGPSHGAESDQLRCRR